MQPIRLINYDDPNIFFDIPWDWLEEKTIGPSLNDLESEANRGKITAYLYRVRAGEVPDVKIPIMKRLTQKELKPLWNIIRPVKLKLKYFEKYEDSFLTIDIYVKKPNPLIYRYPFNNDTDKIIYEPFDLEIVAYGSVS